ncbi:hypothetical protein [Variovorax sp. 770b2]|uniref:hypothetical protein n=1 Tax=Variovorax sp. 770b2 TaxID=1566271 RepID=UPI0008EBCA64|nr:hypothetical protein [Variovorax sp. 770b2]SFQ34038.1 hypothetical protein SAMN03159339_6842 [Variovorax sp. 770b2]
MIEYRVVQYPACLLLFADGLSDVRMQGHTLAIDGARGRQSCTVDAAFQILDEASAVGQGDDGV